MNRREISNNKKYCEQGPSSSRSETFDETESSSDDVDYLPNGKRVKNSSRQQRRPHVIIKKSKGRRIHENVLKKRRGRKELSNVSAATVATASCSNQSSEIETINSHIQHNQPAKMKKSMYTSEMIANGLRILHQETPDENFIVPSSSQENLSCDVEGAIDTGAENSQRETLQFDKVFENLQRKIPYYNTTTILRLNLDDNSQNTALVIDSDAESNSSGSKKDMDPLTRMRNETTERESAQNSVETYPNEIEQTAGSDCDRESITIVAEYLNAIELEERTEIESTKPESSSLTTEQETPNVLRRLTMNDLNDIIPISQNQRQEIVDLKKKVIIMENILSNVRMNLDEVETAYHQIYKNIGEAKAEGLKCGGEFKVEINSAEKEIDSRKQSTESSTDRATVQENFPVNQLLAHFTTINSVVMKIYEEVKQISGGSNNNPQGQFTGTDSSVLQNPGPSGIDQTHQMSGASGINQVYQMPGPSGINQIHQMPGPSGINQFHQISSPSVINQLHHQMPGPSGINHIHQMPHPSGIHHIHQIPGPSGINHIHLMPGSSGINQIHQKSDLDKFDKSEAIHTGSKMSAEGEGMWGDICYFEDTKLVGRSFPCGGLHVRVDCFRAREFNKRNNGFHLGPFRNPDRSRETKSIRSKIDCGIVLYFLKGELSIVNHCRCTVYALSHYSVNKDVWCLNRNKQQFCIPPDETIKVLRVPFDKRTNSVFNLENSIRNSDESFYKVRISFEKDWTESGDNALPCWLSLQIRMPTRNQNVNSR